MFRHPVAVPGASVRRPYSHHSVAPHNRREEASNGVGRLISLVRLGPESEPDRQMTMMPPDPYNTRLAARAGRWLGLSVSIAVSWACVPTPKSDGGPQPPTVELIEERVVSVDPRWMIRGGVFGDSGQLAVFGDSGVHLSSDDGWFERVCSKLKRPDAIGFRGRGVFDVLDRANKRVVRLEPGGACKIAFPLDVAGSIMAGAPSESGWYLIVVEPDHDVPMLAHFEGSGRKQWTKPIPLPLASGSEFLVSSSGGNAVVARFMAPHDWVVLNQLGVEIVRHRGSDKSWFPVGVDADHPQRADWRSVGVLFVGDGFIETIVDLNSDDRILAAFPRGGGPASVRRLATALGFFAANDSRLLAMRRTDRAELVAYKVSWHH